MKDLDAHKILGAANMHNGNLQRLLKHGVHLLLHQATLGNFELNVALLDFVEFIILTIYHILFLSGEFEPLLGEDMLLKLR